MVFGLVRAIRVLFISIVLVLEVVHVNRLRGECILDLVICRMFLGTAGVIRVKTFRLILRA